MRKKILLLSAVSIVLLGFAGFWLTREEPADTRFNGAYLLEDGSAVIITPREGEVLRYRTEDGETGALWPVGNARYEGGGPWAEREPVVNRFEFISDNGRVVGLNWERDGSAPQRAHRMQFTESIVSFESGDLKLRGKLVSPRGTGPYPGVVIVHGSEDYSAVDYYFEPYLYAAHGMATFVFDKRGTGESEGDYLQNFEVLADDVVAAVHWLRQQQQIDDTRVHLAGFSQGGWVAPIAARKDGAIRSLLIGYGVMVPVMAEDRWSYVYALRREGFDEKALAQVDRIDTVMWDILDRHQDRWQEFKELLDAARSEPWFETLRSSDCGLGFVASSDMPMWAIRVYAWWRVGRHRDPPFTDFSYDPVPAMAGLDIPSLWILGGEDSSAPTAWTLAELEKLQEHGKPIDFFVYPNAEHGILRFEDKDGERKLLGYEHDYFARQIDWLRKQSDVGYGVLTAVE